MRTLFLYSLVFLQGVYAQTCGFSEDSHHLQIHY